jgi:exodeoxyribonuclease V gamma subunit
MLHLHHSNRSDTLALALATLLRTDPLPLLEMEYVVVPSTALSRWLGFRLADELGIATRLAFPFPASFAWQLIARVLPDVSQANPFDRSAMQWLLMRLLGESRSPAIMRFLDDDNGLKRHQLAGKLAELFDRYLVERPDWLSLWQAGKALGLGEDEAWQADLWSRMVSDLPGIPAEHPRTRFLSSIRTDPAARARLPRRLSLFAVESMPPLYWETFVALAEWIDLHVFVLSPSREFWGDIDRLRARLRVEIETPGAAALYEVGHPLLASLGRSRRHHVVRLADAAERMGANEHHYFAEPPATLLGRLQRDLLELTSSQDVPRDPSLQVHACHGPLREAEVLHDRLLDLFEHLPDLRPADILILTPDIETYAPAIEAVLQHAPAALRIPCAVADRPLAEAPLWRALRRLCEVAAGELDAESVMTLLEEPSVQRAFDINADELPRLRDWVAEAGIRWGLDGAARARQGLPAEEAHTWRNGLSRLLLGVALPDAPERLYDDMLPVIGIEGAHAELLGRFLDYAEALFALAGKVGAGETAVPAWTYLLADAFDRCLVPDEAGEGEAQRIRQALESLAAHAKTARCEVPLPLTAVLDEIDALLTERAPARAFASGAATIAALRPGRPLPARVLCLVGMNDGAWPRPSSVPGFDLIANHPRQGDREQRGEERYAFLESLLCAGEALVFTYSGRDSRSNVEFPPAAPLAELLDTLAAMTGQAAHDLVVQHPLQPFSPAYFDGMDTELFSFDADQCGASRATRKGRHAPPFLGKAAAPAIPVPEHIELAELQRFLAHPVRHHLRQVLGIHLEEREELLEIHEPFVANGYERYRLREAHFAALQAGADADTTLRLLRARGWLPHGIAGALASDAARDEALPLWQAARLWAQAEIREPLSVDFTDGTITLDGRLDRLCADGLWHLRFGTTRARDLLQLWVEHLLLQVVAPHSAGRVGRRSALIAHDGVSVFAPVADAANHLADLLALYREGLVVPLAFYPETAWAWLAGKSSWRTVWTGSPFSTKPGEGQDAYLHLALRDSVDDPLGADFQQLATRIFAPLRAALTEEGSNG